MMFALLVRKPAAAVVKPRAVVQQRRAVQGGQPRQFDRLAGEFAGRRPNAGLQWDIGKVSVFGPGEPSSSPSLHFQRKLAIRAVDDPLEQEADRTAEQVMRWSAPDLAPASAGPQLRRECAACEAEEQEMLHRKEAGAAEVAPGEAPAIVHDVLRSPGEPLDPATCSFFEPRLGYDFNSVRVHADSKAATAARGVQARAFAVGREIVFGYREYAPATVEGKRLLAHELAHVAQFETANCGTASMLFRQKEEKKEEKKGVQPQPKQSAPKPKSCQPTFKSLEAKTGSPSVQKGDKGCELDLGIPDKSNGVTITGVVNIPPKCNGFLLYTQLVDTCRGWRTDKGEDQHGKSSGFWLDKSDPTLAKRLDDKGGDVTFTFSDIPGQPLRENWVHATVEDSFKVWLSWHPGEPGADRTPLATVTWSWSAEADAKDLKQTDCAKRWIVSKQTHKDGTGQAATRLPAIPDKVAPKDLKTEKGPC